MGKYSIIQWLMWLMVVAGAIGITVIVLHVAGITLPHFIVQILLIVGAVALGIICLGWLAGMINKTPPPST